MRKTRILVKKDDPEIRIKVPYEMYQELMNLAQQNGRTNNAEILVRLASTIDNEEIMATDKLLRAIFGVNGARPMAK